MALVVLGDFSRLTVCSHKLQAAPSVTCLGNVDFGDDLGDSEPALADSVLPSTSCSLPQSLPAVLNPMRR